jgi:transposase
MLKYSLGLDISAKDIHGCISVIDIAQKVTIKATCKISNNRKGFEDLIQWLKEHWKQKDIPLFITMEATGVYYEHGALFLFQQGYNVSVVLPNKAKKYLQATGLKSKNDKIDARGLSRMGAEQALELWQPMGEYFYQLRSLSRHHQSLQELKTNVSNQLHADERGMYFNKEVTGQLMSLLATLNAQIEEVEQLIKHHIESDKEVARKVADICMIKGVGMQTVATLLAETNGFLLFKNAGQLVSYAGYDVVQNESGSHIGKTRISRKGNSRIRRALHLPALNVIRYEVRPFIQLFNRTLDKHHIKMKSYVAVQKKLLVIIYTLWKNQVAFSGNYVNSQFKKQQPAITGGINNMEYKKNSVGYTNATQGKIQDEQSPCASSEFLQN